MMVVGVEKGNDPLLVHQSNRGSWVPITTLDDVFERSNREGNSSIKHSQVVRLSEEANP